MLNTEITRKQPPHVLTRLHWPYVRALRTLVGCHLLSRAKRSNAQAPTFEQPTCSYTETFGTNAFISRAVARSFAVPDAQGTLFQHETRERPSRCGPTILQSRPVPATPPPLPPISFTSDRLETFLLPYPPSSARLEYALSRERHLELNQS